MSRMNLKTRQQVTWSRFKPERFTTRKGECWPLHGYVQLSSLFNIWINFRVSHTWNSPSLYSCKDTQSESNTTCEYIILFTRCWTQGWQSATENNIVTKSKEAMAGLSEIRRPTKRFTDLRIGSWNILSLYRSQSLQMLLDQVEKYHGHITCVQEMRWIGSGTIGNKNWKCCKE